MQRLFILVCLLSLSAGAAVTIDPEFWKSYRPYQQYSREMIRDLAALGEGDLLETARAIDGLELRVVGRHTSASKLVSARIVIDSVARRRLQVKIVPFELSPSGIEAPAVRRRQVTPAQAEALMALLDDSGFWDAPYDLEAPDTGPLGCSDAGQWVIEGVRPGTYQLIVRSECGGLETAAAEIRGFLLDLAGVSAIDAPPPQ